MSRKKYILRVRRGRIAEERMGVAAPHGGQNKAVATVGGHRDSYPEAAGEVVAGTGRIQKATVAVGRVALGIAVVDRGAVVGLVDSHILGRGFETGGDRRSNLGLDSLTSWKYREGKAANFSKLVNLRMMK